MYDIHIYVVMVNVYIYMYIHHYHVYMCIYIYDIHTHMTTMDRTTRKNKQFYQHSEIFYFFYRKMKQRVIHECLVYELL